ncbi:MAG: efflux transporter outer membrane subunit [Deferrisomatales bacterium]|nr:efflux transporter outer membrane subunit [Deferrisomatales bacterium]
MACGLLGLSIACAPVLREVPDPVLLPAAFSAIPAVPESEPLPDRWWQSFDDPGLDRMVERALTGNLNLLGAWDRLHQAQAVARRAGAQQAPSLGGQAGVGREFSWTKGQDGAETSLSLGLVAGYEVDLWGRLRSRTDAARLEVLSSEEELKTAAITLAAAVATAWYGLGEQVGQLELLNQQLAVNEKVLELLTVRWRNGQAAAVDILQQRQLLAARRGEQAQVRGRVAVLEHELAILCGMAPGAGAAAELGTAGTRVAALPPLPDAGVPAQLIRRRPDVRSAYYQVAAADHRVAEAIAERYPQLSLSARLSTSGGEIRDLFTNWFASLAANLLGPIFDAGARQAEVDRTRAAAEERLHRYGQISLEALGEVEDALVREQRTGEYIDSLDEQLSHSAAAMERLRDRYVLGSESYLRVLLSLDNHQQLQRTRLRASRELIDQRIALCRALGGGWTMESPGAASGGGGAGP